MGHFSFVNVETTIFFLVKVDFANFVFIQKLGMLKEGEQVALVQSGRQPIWRSESTHHIQVRTVQDCTPTK
jgi:hypothetical protein